MPSVAIDVDKTLALTSRESEYNQRRAMGGLVAVDDSGGALATNVVKVDQLDLTMPWDGFNNYLNNCGPSCVSMVLCQARQVRMWPDAIVDWMRGEGHSGYTSSVDLDRFLDAHGVPSSHGQFTSLADFKARIREQVSGNRLTIILIWADQQANSGGHFVVVYGCDEPNADVAVMNPWHGVVNTYGWDTLYSELKSGRYRVLALKGPQRFTAYPESWTAWTTTGVNLRREPFITSPIIKVLPSARRYTLTKYTDGGTAVGPTGNRRWHYNGEGWVSDVYLYRWERT